MKWAGTRSYCIGSLIKQTTRRTFLPLLYSRPPCFQEKQCSSAWSPVYFPSADTIIFQWCKHTHTASSCYGFWLPRKLMSSWQHLLSTEAKGQSAEQTMKHRAEIPEAPHTHSMTHASQLHELIYWLVLDEDFLREPDLTCSFQRLIKRVMQQLNTFIKYYYSFIILLKHSKLLKCQVACNFL